MKGVGEEPHWKEDWDKMWKQLERDKLTTAKSSQVEDFNGKIYPILVLSKKEESRRIKVSKDFKTEYYKSVWWAYISTKNKQDNNYTCEHCGDKDGTKEAHHKRYTNIGTHAELEDLECLCVPCHEEHHEKNPFFDWRYSVEGETSIQTKL